MKQIVLDYVTKNYPNSCLKTYVSELLYDLTLVDAVTCFYNSTNTYSSFSAFYSVYLTQIFPSRLLYKSVDLNINLILNTLGNIDTKFSDFNILGDIHSNSIKYKKGKSLAYSNMFGYESIINCLIEAFPEFGLFFPTYKIKDHIVYRSFVKNQTPVTNLSRFFYEVGRLITFGLFFRMLDLNNENVLATSSSGLYAFDIETLFVPEYKAFPYCIKSTGLLSGQLEDNTSALLGGYFKVNSYLKPILEGTDSLPTIIWKAKSKNKFINLPCPPSIKSHPFNHITNLKAGMLEGLKYIEKNKSKILNIIQSANNFKTRLLIRPTRVYRYLQFEYAYSQNTVTNLRSFQHRFKILLTKAPKLKCGNFYSELISFEVDELYKLSIPMFLSEFNSTQIYSSTNQIVGKLSKTPKEYFLQHADAFQTFAHNEILEVETILADNYNEYILAIKQNKSVN